MTSHSGLGVGVHLVSAVLVISFFCCCLVTKSCPTLWPHGPQHPRPPCPSLSPRVCPSSCPLNQWYDPTVSTSVILFSFCLRFFPILESFPMIWLFAPGGQSIGASASASVLPMIIQGRLPLRLVVIGSQAPKWYLLAKVIRQGNAAWSAHTPVHLSRTTAQGCLGESRASPGHWRALVLSQSLQACLPKPPGKGPHAFNVVCEEAAQEKWECPRACQKGRISGLTSNFLN